MRVPLIVISLCLALPAAADDAAGKREKVVILIHGGAADRADRKEMNRELEKQYRAGLEDAARAGYAKLKRHGSSLDAVEAAVRTLEDDPMFNAGKGAVYTHEGKVELDASIMDGKTMKAGAVANVTIIKNPISAARAVMEKTRHVMLVSKGAEQFAKDVELEIVTQEYFKSEKREKEWNKSIQDEERRKASSFSYPRTAHWGTVGAVALDEHGNLAAGTSTGGLTNKRFGRVGDSPIIGAGTYADNEGVAISCTGIGEYFIRFAAAHDVDAIVRYKGFTIQKAADVVLHGRLKSAGGEGAMIGLDRNGNPAISSNVEGIFHAYVTEGGAIHSGIFFHEQADNPCGENSPVSRVQDGD
jgi:L-asparaginase / beta-aspartyl-peptidase